MGFIVGVFTGFGIATMLLDSVPMGLLILAVATLITVFSIAKD